MLSKFLLAGLAFAQNQTYYTGGKPELRTDPGNGTYGTTNRTGVASDANLTAPAPITGKPYDPALQNSTHKDSNSYTDSNKYDLDVINKYLAGETNACSAKGMICDFKDYTKMGADYLPMDFIWKIVDPLDHGKHPYLQRTLNCEVEITVMSNTTRDFFYVPLGQANSGSKNYCNVEGLRRTYQDSENQFKDMIRVRGEAARLNNYEASDNDLVGEQFDVICTCTNDLDVEVSLNVQHLSKALITEMNGTEMTRALPIELLLYSDPELTNKIVSGADVFPRASQFFYFLAKHENAEDWDVQVQITDCVACNVGAGSPISDCTTRSANANAVLFWESCGVLQGGPQTDQPDSQSWYFNSSVTPPEPWKVTNRWSDESPTRCPYHAVGIQKFRLAGSANMRITCRITACTARPCPPCTNRRLLEVRNRRSLQAAFGLQEIGLNINLGQENAAAADNKDDATSKSEKSAKGVNGTQIALLIVVLILLVMMMQRTRNIVQKRNEQQKSQTVKPQEDETKAPQGRTARA